MPLPRPEHVRGMCSTPASNPGLVRFRQRAHRVLARASRRTTQARHLPAGELPAGQRRTPREVPRPSCRADMTSCAPCSRRTTCIAPGRKRATRSLPMRATPPSSPASARGSSRPRRSSRPSRKSVGIADAIRERRILRFSYGGSLRRVEPHAYGTDRLGQELLLAWQLGGGSESGSSVGWKMPYVPWLPSRSRPIPSGNLPNDATAST